MKRILLVEDSVLDTELTMRAMDDCLTDHAIECAVDANEVYRLMSERRFDLLVLDLKMPGGDGFEVLRWIQRDAPYRLPVIVMSISLLERDQYLVSKLGGVEYVEKKIDFAEFKVEIKAAMQRQGFC